MRLRFHFNSLMLVLCASAVWAQPVLVDSTSPALERWMYPFNASPCDRIAGSSFGTLGDDSGVDTRHAQHLVGWDTESLVATNRGASRYLIRRCRLTLTINRGNLFAFDPTQDDFRTFFETNHAAYLPDVDAGRPVELFGVGYRNGYDSATFTNCTPFGSATTGQRNAFAAGWATNGTLVDVGNNTGKTNDAFPRFEVWPFAIGQTTNAAPGELVPAGAQVTFDLNLADPFVVTYLQHSLNEGRLRFALTSLHGSAGQFGLPNYPDFATRFNQAVIDPTRLELEVTVVRDLDTDGDGLPDDWEQFWFDDLTHSAGDSDLDGASNADEFLAGTNPKQADSVFRVAAIARSATGEVTLRWPNLPSRRFEVDATDHFSSWQTLTNPVLTFPDPQTAVWIDSSPSSPKFYQVRAVAQ